MCIGLKLSLLYRLRETAGQLYNIDLGYTLVKPLLQFVHERALKRVVNLLTIANASDPTRGI